MGKRACAALVALTLAACADKAPPTAADAAAAISTPLYVVGKSVTCASTLGIAAPLGALAALAPGDDARYFQGEIEQGLATNCGPPYVLMR